MKAMNETLPPCPACGEAYTYEDRDRLVCPMCAHEWAPGESADDSGEPAARVVKDANGNVLAGEQIASITPLQVA